MFCAVVSTGCGGSSSNDSAQTESLSEDTGTENLTPDTGEDTTYDPNEGGKGNAGGTAGTISFTLNASRISYNLKEATLYDRKNLGNNKLSFWLPLLKLGNSGRFSEMLNGAQQAQGSYSIPSEFVEFGFEFDSRGVSWAYSDVFWKASQSQNEKVESISVVLSGLEYDAAITINVNDIDILPMPKGRGFWYHQTLPAETGLTGSTPMADAPAIFLFSLYIFMINASIIA